MEFGPTDEADMRVKIKEIEMKLERIQDHNNLYRKSIDEMSFAITSLNATMKDIHNDLKALSDVPERLKSIETDNIRRGAYMTTVKIVVGVLIGLVVTHLINSYVLAPLRDDNDIKIEKSE